MALIDNAPMIDTVNSPYIHAATSENFNSLVLDNSNKGPVLVNFWSRKAGPCLRQYPILDQLIHHYDGRVLLINVDIENEFVFTKEYGVTSVPTLKIFRHEQVIKTLHGYQSETDLTKLLDIYVTRDSDLILSKVIQLYSEGKHTQAYQMITDAIVEDPANPRLPLTMCKLVMHEGRYPEAIKLIHSLPDDIQQHDDIRQLRNLLEFYDKDDLESELETLLLRSEQEPNDLVVKKKLITHYVFAREFEKALDLLVQIMDLEPSFQEHYAQQAMLKIFSILGDGHPLISQYRTNLQRYTY